MPKLKDLQPKNPNILIYGPPGSGKTALALTAGSTCQVIDIDNGTTTGLYLDDKFQDARKEADVIPCNESDPNKARAFRSVRDEVWRIGQKISSNSYSYEVLVVDSLTSLSDAAIRWVMDNSNMLGQQPQIQHWGLAFNEIESLIHKLRAMPVVVVLLAHDQKTVLNDNQTKIEIAIQGQKLPAKISRYFDEILYSETKLAAKNKTEYRLRTKSTSSIVASSRYNLPEEVDPSIGLPEILRRYMNVEIGKEAADEASQNG